jgi:conjugative transposon TraM protein
MAKLTLLEKEINKQPELKNEESLEKYHNNQSDEFSNEVDRLENMMQMMNKTGSEHQEMQQLNGTLEKILDIQHPQRMKDKLKEKSLLQREVVFAVDKQPVNVNVSLLDTIKKKALTADKFYGIDENKSQPVDNNAIEAVVHANQVLVNGAVIKLRLTTDIYINGTLITKGNCVYGIASLNDERLEIEINSIRSGNSLFPVKLEVYDMDGMPGIYIPGAIIRDVAKQSADNGLQLMELTSMDPSLKAQATAAGINTVKTMLSRKVKQVKVVVKAGYKVLLQDKNIQQ